MLSPSPRALRIFLLFLAGCVASCQTGGGSIDVVESGHVPAGAVHAEDLLVVDCLLPGQVRKLGRSQIFMTPRRPLKTAASECEIRGGEYVAYDRADYRTALRVWKLDAEEGDAKAQNYVGEIYEKGLGVAPDYVAAAKWYRLAADQGLERAMLNLGQLYELGNGVEADPGQALAWYRKASGLAKAGLDYQMASDARPAAERAQDDVLLAAASAPPSIQLIEPPIPETRGISVVRKDQSSRARSAGQERTLVGRVTAPAGLVALLVDDVEQQVDSEGLFRAAVPMQEGGREVVIAAVDRQGRRGERRLRLEFAEAERSASPAPVTEVEKPKEVDFGSYHALVIGNSNYQHLPSLQTARADADAVADVLQGRYGFRVKLIRDATRYDILSALNEMRAQLTEEDNLLIYYAGHGELDKVNMRGQWLPVDAERASTANWISNVAITDILNAMNTQHVMIVSDSCYSGALTRSSLATLDGGLSDEKRAAWFQALASKRSRTALTSGGLAPVLDAGGGGHSVFARAFLDVLRQNESLIEGQRLYQELSARVTYAASNYEFEQMPQYAPIKYSGHEAGDFFLVPQI
jgi:Caspase domain/Sel1 repeat